MPPLDRVHGFAAAKASAPESEFLEGALLCASRGWPVFPLNPRSKVPLKGSHGFLDATLDETQIRKWWTKEPNANIGVPTGIEFWALDVDPRHGGDESLRMLIYENGPLNDTLQNLSGGGGRHYFYANPDGRKMETHGAFRDGIDIKGIGGYVLVPPSIHPKTGKPYEWDGAEPFLKQKINQASDWLLALLAKKASEEPREPLPIDGVIPHGKQHYTLLRLAIKIRKMGAPRPMIFAAIWEGNQKQCERPDKTPDRMNKMADWVMKHITPWTGPPPPRPPEPPLPAPPPEVIAAPKKESHGDSETPPPTSSPDATSEPDDLAPPTSPPDLLGFQFTDTGNAERLVALYGHDMRYAHKFKKWLIWDGRRWALDEAEKARLLAEKTILAFYQQGLDREEKDDPDEKKKGKAAKAFAHTCLNQKRLGPMLSLAQYKLPIAPNQLDAAGWLLNFKNGTVNLRTGELRPHRRADFITRMVHYNFNPAALCPCFRSFLARIMGYSADASEDQLRRADELIQYLRSAFGYSITTDTSEKVVFVAHGAGDNGKTTLLSIVRELIEEYSTSVPLDLLTTKERTNNVDAAKAELLAKRFVTASETEKGQKLSAARLKQICQGPGGEILACRKHENPIVFQETHKLWVDVNHKPVLPPDDKAVWKRIRLIPFTVTIPYPEQNRHLKEELLAEEPEGILAWLVESSVRWHAEGLSQSELIDAATQGWRKSSLDSLGEFLEQNTEKVEGVIQFRKDRTDEYVSAQELHTRYRAWWAEQEECKEEEPVSKRKLTNVLLGMGYVKHKTEEGVVILGLRFKTSEEPKD